MEAYGEQLIEGDNGKSVKIVSIPSFFESQQLILMDLETLQTYTLAFNLSDEILSVGKANLKPQELSQEQDIVREMIIDE